MSNAKSFVLPATNTPLVSSGLGDVGTSLKYAREDHVHPAAGLPVIPIGSPVSRTVAFATAYQATNTAKPAQITILLDLAVSINIGAASNTANLVIGPTNAVASGTGTIIDAWRNDLSVTLISIGLTGRQSVRAIIPAGWYFAVIRSVGTGLTVGSAFEQAIG